MNDKYISRTNADDREDAIKAQGDTFWTTGTNKEVYSEPNVPPLFLFIYTSFIEIYNHTGESLTWTQIESYAKMRKIDFTQNEINLILKMNSWANQEVEKLRKENE